MASLNMGLGVRSCADDQGRLPGVHSAAEEGSQVEGTQSMMERGQRLGPSSPT